MRRFDSRRQSDTESLVEYETALRILYKETWPDASFDQRDAALKRRFEDRVSSVELSQYLRLHHRSLDLADHVLNLRKKLSPDSVQRHAVLVLLLRTKRTGSSL